MRADNYHRAAYHRAATLLASALLLLGVACGAAGQEKKKAVRVSLRGTVFSATPGLFTAKAEGKVYKLKFDTKKNIVIVTGNLDRSELQRGMLVRVVGPLKGNAIEGEVAEIKVYGAGDGYQSGVLLDAPDQPATVSGQLAKIKGNNLTIAAGRKNVNVKLADDAQVVVDTKDYTILKGGEAIHFDGTVAGDGMTVTCRKITVTIGKTADDEAKPSGKKKKAN
jgi:hypothetical protein